MSVVFLDSGSAHYEVLGRGKPVVFLHGWVGSWRYWLPAMQATSISYRAYALDLWGFGDSSKTQHYEIDQQMGLIDGFLEKMGIGRVVLVGHGLGAIAAMAYAWKNPQVVDRLMAVSYPLEESNLAARLRTSTPADLADWLLPRVPAADAARAELPKADPGVVSSSFNRQPNLDGAWRQFGTPCLLVNGVNDPAVLAPRPEQLNELPEQSHAVLFDPGGHFPMMDDANKFNRLIVDFLSLASGESPRNLQLKEEWKRRVR
ncbi:predicted hydrolase [Longilinea arvoryzae]|uniref:Predicted hydrolase n=1 Tax=Longilinea arvoryzae TaxID=360412 RepID=A0A0S7BH11_9CHLR|nr:alpha/beta hydrolase [Longilinea arvoryzae]GAP13814.1 predicted hydrolase [Longilinea arvoryzae]